MNAQGRACVALSAKHLFIGTLLISALVIFVPLSANAQETQSNSSLLESIRGILQEYLTDVSADIQSLRDEVRQLRSEVKSLQMTNDAGGIEGPLPFPTEPGIETRYNVPAAPLSHGSQGNEVVRLQQLLVRFGYGIPAGITGNFLTQTQEAIRKLQQAKGIPITGMYDEATRAVLLRLNGFSAKPAAPAEVTPDVPKKPSVEVRLHVSTPSEGMLLNAGANLPIVWSTIGAPEGSLVNFRLVNVFTKEERFLFTATSTSRSYDWVAPSDMPGDNQLIAELFSAGEPAKLLAKKTVTFAILGGFTPKPKTNTENSDSTSSYSADDTSFYLGSEFITCMAEYPDTIALIHGWIDSGLTRDQFPWGDITGSAANKVAECEGGAFYDGEFYYSDTSQMYSCFYPNATVSGEPPGYTVWCEYDYVNCRVGDPSGDSVSLDGLALGAPSTCESGGGSGGDITCTGTSESTCTSEVNCYWNAESSYCYYDLNGDPTSALPTNSFVANVVTAFSKAFDILKRTLGF